MSSQHLTQLARVVLSVVIVIVAVAFYFGQQDAFGDVLTKMDQRLVREAEQRKASDMSQMAKLHEMGSQLIKQSENIKSLLAMMEKHSQYTDESIRDKKQRDKAITQLQLLADILTKKHVGD